MTVVITGIYISVVVDEGVLAGVVGGVDVDEVDRFFVRVQQGFEYVEVLPIDGYMVTLTRCSVDDVIKGLETGEDRLTEGLDYDQMVNRVDFGKRLPSWTGRCEGSFSILHLSDIPDLRGAPAQLHFAAASDLVLVQPNEFWQVLVVESRGVV